MRFTRADGTPGLTPDRPRSLDRYPGAMVAPGLDARWRGNHAKGPVNTLDVLRAQQRRKRTR